MSWQPTKHTWDPTQQGTPYADNTAAIHRVLAWFYGVIGALVLAAVLVLTDRSEGVGIAAAIGAFFGGMTLLHAALRVGARRHNGLAQAGSVVIGVLMLFGFPIGTVVGGMLIYNGVQSWPPRRDPGAEPPGPDLRGA